MDRILQPGHGGVGGVAPTPSTWPSTTGGPSAGHLAHPTSAFAPPPPQHPHTQGPSHKSPGDYLRALRRRPALSLAVALLVGVAGSVWVVRQPNVYKTSSQIKIDPPQGDPALAIIIPNGAVGNLHDRTVETYVPNLMALLRGSKGLAERAVNDPQVADLPEPGIGDPASDLLANLTSRPLLPATNAYEVSLEGKNPERVAKLLNVLLELFASGAEAENLKKIDKSIRLAGQNLEKMKSEKDAIDEQIRHKLTGTIALAPGGVNLVESRYTAMATLLSQKRARYDDLLFTERLAKLRPTPKSPVAQSPLELQIGVLAKEKALLQKRETKARRLVPRSDPSYRHVRGEIEDIEAEIADLRRRIPRPTPAVDATALAMRHAEADIQSLERQADEILGELKETAPEHQSYLTLLADRERKVLEIATTVERLAAFDMLAKTQNAPIHVESRAVEPTAPVRPKRTMLIAAFIVLGIALGSGLVMLLEFLDHSVKVPEHLTAGLTLPLLGVIPRMKRLAGIHRGGHLWTAGAPRSIEADAFRNLRAGLLGLSGPRGPIVTLLVTSAKAGEGKSTTALNLAATCAKSGERTLLLDIDLRRPSLGPVFLQGDSYHAGLVDILRGDMPWQRAVVHTDIPLLDFLPTGDPSDVPIEVLGTLELRQLLAALSGHYDRVILDGPAVLGLADCRMLGRMVDAAVLVVRSGAHELKPLQRAKAMLAQSQVTLAGIAFNGVAEDYENWSSYGNDGLPARSAAGPTPRGLDAPADEALVAGTSGLS